MARHAVNLSSVALRALGEGRVSWQVESTVQPELVQKLDSLHFLHSFLLRLDLIAIVNRICGRGPSREISHGEVFHALVLGRLAAGPHAPLYLFSEWARSVAFEAVTGLNPELLNDDRLARTLDVVFAHLTSLQTALALHAVQVFQLSLHHCLWDVTSVLLTGAHPDEPGDDREAAPKVRRGYSRSGAPKKRQVRVVTTATADGAVPLLHATCDGNTEDASTVIPAFEALRTALAGVVPTRLLLTGDTKASGAENLEAIAAADGWVITPLAASDRLTRVLRSQLPRLQPLAYGRKPATPTLPTPPPAYGGAETDWEIKAKQKPKRRFRLLVIRAAEERRAIRVHRRKQYDRLVQALQEFQRKLAHPYYRDHPERIEPAVQRLRQEAGKLGKFLRVTVTGAEVGKTAQLTWCLERALLRAVMELDGVYGLVTNLPAQEADLSAALEAWKEQKHLEKRFRNLKGPLAVQPVFLSKPSRIAALLLVLLSALSGFTLLEREVRRNLPAGETRLTGLLARGVKSRPTAASVLRPFAGLLVRWRRGEAARTLVNWTPQHAELYRLAGVAIPRAG